MLFGKRNTKRPQIDFWLLGTIIAYAMIAVLLLPYFRYHLQNDSFAYLSLAASKTTNAYWGPLLPLLIRGGTWLGLDPLTAIRAPSIIASIGLLLLTGTLKKNLSLSLGMWRTGVATLGTLLLMKTLDIATPDILLTFLMALMMRCAMLHTIQGAVLAGIIGAIGYLTKSVGLPFFLLFTAGIGLEYWLRERKAFGKIAIRLGASIAICGALVSPWIWSISMEEGKFTIGESAHIIHATMNPLQDREIPMNVRGLLPPPSGVALSIWDDPTTLTYEDWSPFTSLEHTVMQLRIIIINATRMIDVVFKEFWLVWGIAAASIVFSLQRKPSIIRSWSRLISGVWILLLGMYLPIVTDDRYVWIGIILAMALGAILMNEAMTMYRWDRRQSIVAMTLFFLSFTAYPSWRTINAFNDGKVIAADAKKAASILRLEGARTASDNWKVGLAFSYYAGAKYYGRPVMPEDGTEVSKQLKKDGIDIYLMTGKRIDVPGYKEIMTPASSIRILRSVER